MAKLGLTRALIILSTCLMLGGGLVGCGDDSSPPDGGTGGIGGTTGGTAAGTGGTSGGTGGTAAGTGGTAAGTGGTAAGTGGTGCDAGSDDGGDLDGSC